jgi:hypothetical protein
VGAPDVQPNLHTRWRNHIPGAPPGRRGNEGCYSQLCPSSPKSSRFAAAWNRG